jgi:hypothetical protein
MKKKELTPEQIAEKEAAETHNRRVAGFVRSLKSECSDYGLRSVELKLEFLEQNPTTRLPKPYFDHAQTVACFRRAINEYKDAL